MTEENKNVSWEARMLFSAMDELEKALGLCKGTCIKTPVDWVRALARQRDKAQQEVKELKDLIAGIHPSAVMASMLPTSEEDEKLVDDLMKRARENKDG